MIGIGKNFEQFRQLIQWAIEGKTFIFFHPKMVCIDMKTWDELQSKLTPKLIITYDEYDNLTPERMEELEKITKKWLTRIKKK
jgi:hypothetical protein